MSYFSSSKPLAHANRGSRPPRRTLCTNAQYTVVLQRRAVCSCAYSRYASALHADEHLSYQEELDLAKKNTLTWQQGLYEATRAPPAYLMAYLSKTSESSLEARLDPARTPA